MKNITLVLPIATGLLLFGSLLPVTAQTPPSYTIYSLGANTTGLSVSQDGNYVTGLYYNDGGFSNPEAGFLWTQSGGAVTLPAVGSPDHVDASPNAVNDSGVVAGAVSSTTYGAGALPVLYSNSSSATILPLPAASTVGKAYGINNSGTVVGTIQSAGNWYATIFGPTDASVILQTTTDGLILQYANGIANTGRIVGQAGNGSTTAGFYLDSGASNAVNIGSLPNGSSLTEAFGISGNGNYITGASGANPFIYQPGTATMTAIPLLANCTSGQGESVNSSGWVVGDSGGETSIPFLYDGTNTYSLQNLLNGADSLGWNMTNGTGNAALGISDNGLITGRALYDGVNTGFVMVPTFATPEPSTYALLGIGAFALVIAYRRKVA